MYFKLIFLLLIGKIITTSHNEDSIGFEDENTGDSLEKQLYDELKTDEKLEQLLEDYFLDRDKKNNKNSRLFPQHGQHFDNEQQQQVNDATAKKSCFELMHVIENKITHSKKSIANGAQFLDVKYVNRETPELVLHENCMKMCCETRTCDTALLSLESGEDGYRCYLFNCSNKCIYDDHKDYSVMTMNDFEKPAVTAAAAAIPLTECRSHEFACKKPVGTCIPIYDVCNYFADCEDGSDELNCTEKQKKPVTTTTTTTTTTTSEAPVVDDDLVDLAENLLKSENDDDEDEVEDDVQMYSKDDKEANERVSSETLEDILHQELLDTFKPKFRFGSDDPYEQQVDDDDDDDDIFTNIKSKIKPPPKAVTTTTTTTRKIATTIASVGVTTEMKVQSQPVLASNGSEEDYSSGVTLAIFLLVIGISLTIGLFIYSALSTNYNNRRFRWPNFKYRNKNSALLNSTDAEADYLINGMYL